MVEKKIGPRSSGNLQKTQFVDASWLWANQDIITTMRTVAEVGGWGQPGNPVQNMMSEISDPELPERLAETMDMAIRKAEASQLSEGTSVVPFTPTPTGGKVEIFNPKIAERLMRTGNQNVCNVDRYVEILDETHMLEGAARDKAIDERLSHYPAVAKSLTQQDKAAALIRFTQLIELQATGELYVKTGDNAFTAFDEQASKLSTDGRLYGRGGKSLGNIDADDTRYDYSGLENARIDELRIETVRNTAQAFFESFDLPGLGAKAAALLPGGQPHVEEVTKKRLKNKGQKEI
jgi:hypothetical protein